MTNTMNTYTYSILRFIPDVRTGEFLNVGIAIHSAKGNYGKSLCRNTIGRITKLNQDIDGYAVLRLIKGVQSNFDAVGKKHFLQLSFEAISDVTQLCNLVLPKDDSSLQWSVAGAGRCNDLDAELKRLYTTFVSYADEDKGRERRDEAEIWKTFSRELKDKKLLERLGPKTFYASADEMKFDHAYKNGSWHCIQPVSFDLLHSNYIKEKAHKWLGQLASVQKENDSFQLYFLLAQPQDERLLESYEDAKKILAKSQNEIFLYEEREGVELAERFEEIVQGSPH